MRLYASGFATQREAAESASAKRARANGLYAIDVRPRERDKQVVECGISRTETRVTWEIWRERLRENASRVADLLGDAPHAPTVADIPNIDLDRALRDIARSGDKALAMQALCERLGLAPGYVRAAFALCRTTGEAADMLRRMAGQNR